MKSRVTLSATLIASIVLLLAALLTLELRQSYRQEILSAQAHTGSMARVLEWELLASVGKVDLITREAQYHYEGSLNGAGLPASQINPMLKRLLDQVPGVLSLRITNEAGNYVFDASGELSPVNEADRHYFQVHKTGQAHGLFVEGPLFSRIANLWTVTFSRAIHDQDGRFRGVVQSSIPTQWLTTAFGKVSTDSQDSVTLLNSDLVRVARVPEIPELIGQTITSSEIKAELRKPAPQGSFSGFTQRDGVTRIYSYRRVVGLPLNIIVGVGKQQVLSEWRRQAIVYAVVALLLMSGGIALVAYSYRTVKKSTAQEEARYKELLRTATDGVHILDAQGNLLEASESFYRMLGYDPVNCPPLNVVDWDVCYKPGELRASMNHQITHLRLIESQHRRSDGSIIQVEISTRGIQLNNQRLLYCSSRDITERKKAEAAINDLAFFDPLTRLPNRTLLLNRLERAMALGARNSTCGALLFIDLDNFKTLNDAFGHGKGDLLLQQAAQRLIACVREVDTVARLGGDEFVVVLESLTVSAAEAKVQTTVVGEKLLAALGEIYLLGDVHHHSTASIGATLFWGTATPMEDVLKQADLAMYQAKTTGRNALHFFDPPPHPTSPPSSAT
jgi:diguanylate cyclase (GGDEF)-like protein/PAS domain S-box-containing protein